MDHIVYPGYDPLGTDDFIVSAAQVTFTAILPEGYDWMKLRQRINRELEQYLEGMFDVVISSSIQNSQESVEYTLFVEKDDEEKARHYLEHRTWH